jgi:hypothetical protein
VVAPTDLIWLLFFTAVPLIATTLLLCAEANVVRTDHLYPRAPADTVHRQCRTDPR